MFDIKLPIHDIIPDLLSALETHQRAVLMAPPGAGKTTCIPLALMQSQSRKIIMLEPRRLAARSAAERMAQSLSETVGQTVGYRMRGETKISPHTKIEVVTEGILTRIIQSDPELSEYSAIIFDEFHERSLNADLGLALTWEITEALRDDLTLLVMSATLDAAPIAKLLNNAPIIQSKGRAFPVEMRWLKKPLNKTQRFEQAAADLILQAISEEKGSALVFLPGEREIRNVEKLLANNIPSDCGVYPLFGTMNFAAQRAAIAPSQSGRKIVLATSIAETSLTIEDVRIVVDTGKARRAKFDPSSGMSRLVTERVSKAEAEQRKGRAGRVQEGVCYRMWSKGEEGAMPAFPPAEIEITDLSGFALELAKWGTDGSDLAFLTPAPKTQLSEARNLLKMFGALDQDNKITPHGEDIAQLPLHPRLAHMLTQAGTQAADLAALLNARDPIRSRKVDLNLRIRAIASPTKEQRGAIEHIRKEAKRLRRFAPKTHKIDDLSLAEMAALAYPDRIALRRKGNEARYILSGGKGAKLPIEDELSNQRLLIVTDTNGETKDATIRQAISITESEIRGLFHKNINWHDICEWSRREGKVIARKRETLGAITFEDRIWHNAPNNALSKAALEGFKQIGLPWSKNAKRFIARVRLLSEQLPDFSDEYLISHLDDWLEAYISGIKTEAEIRKFDITEALKARLSWEELQQLDREVPASFETPLGRKIPIDYSGDHPEIIARLQEMFGTKTHPTIAGNPLRVVLTSPAHSAVQTTMDLPKFWQTSYADVRKDMRGRYPKHPWPEDPSEADPTLRAKKRR